MVVEFYKTKNRYVVIDDSAKMKDPQTGEWVKAVVYRNHKNYDPTLKDYVEVPYLDSMTFVREKVDFLKKFESCLDL